MRLSIKSNTDTVQRDICNAVRILTWEILDKQQGHCAIRKKFLQRPWKGVSGRARTGQNLNSEIPSLLLFGGMLKALCFVENLPLLLKENFGYKMKILGFVENYCYY